MAAPLQIRDPAGVTPAHRADASDNAHLRDELERLRAEHSRLVEQQSRLMELIGCTDPSRLVHDIRNVLNERELLRALANLGE